MFEQHANTCGRKQVWTSNGKWQLEFANYDPRVRLRMVASPKTVTVLLFWLMQVKGHLLR